MAPDSGVGTSAGIKGPESSEVARGDSQTCLVLAVFYTLSAPRVN